MAWRGLARWVLVVSLLLVGLIVAASAAVWTTRDQAREAQVRGDDLVRAAQLEAALLTGYVDEQTGLRGYLLTLEPRFLEPYDRARAANPALVTDLRTRWLALGAPIELVDRLDDAHAAWLALAQQRIDLVAAGDTEQATSIAATTNGQEAFDALRDQESTVADWLTDAQGRTADRLAELQMRITLLLAASLAMLLLVVVTGGLVLWRAVVRPLALLAGATRAVAAGDLGAELPAGGAPEMRRLAADVTAMRDRLAADLHSTRQALDALEQTGPAVSALRKALEPTGDRVAGVEVAARLDAAEGVLAGDWYDTVALSGTRLGVVVGDVAGHGPASAVFALRLKHSLLAALRAGLPPDEALAAVHADLGDVPVGQFATVFVGVVDAAAGTVAHANAGHPSGLVLGRSGVELPPTGPLLSSALPEAHWRTEVVDLVPGDVLLVCTDGVLETRDATGAEFGTEGIHRAVGDGAEDLGRVVEAIAAASMRFGGRGTRPDDHTVVCLRWGPPDQAWRT